MFDCISEAVVIKKLNCEMDSDSVCVSVCVCCHVITDCRSVFMYCCF